MTLYIDSLEVDADGKLRLPTGTTLPATPSDGDVFFKSDTKILYVYDGTGAAWVPLAASNNLPELRNAWIDFRSAAQTVDINKTVIGWTDVVSLSWTPAAGTYMFVWSVEFTNSGVNNETYVRFWDGTTVRNAMGHEPESTIIYMPGVGIYVQALTATAQTWAIQYNMDGGTAYARRGRIAAWRVA